VKYLNTSKDYPLFILSLMMALPLAISLRTAFAQTIEANTLLMERVWTRDGNGNDKTTFVPNDVIQYTTLIRNTYNQPVKAMIRFEAHGPTWVGDIQNPADRFIFLYEQQEVDVPVGLTGYYSPSTIPNSAQPGSYRVTISISWPEGGKALDGFPFFSIPGTLATDISTFLSDGVTPTSAGGATVGPGSALVYKITVTNTSHPSTGNPSVDNTGVVLTDPLPPEIFDIIGTPTTDHGTCNKAGAHPSTTITCLLGSLAPGETATIYFTASIIVRDPSGEPKPPESFVNTVHVESDQQGLTSASVKTLVTAEELTDAEALAFLDAAAGCVALAGIGSIAGWVWEMLGRDLATGQPSTYREKLVQAVDLGSKDMLVETLRLGGHQVGLRKDVFSPIVDSVECIAGFRAFLSQH
jgi:hypothetical protein